MVKVCYGIVPEHVIDNGIKTYEKGVSFSIVSSPVGGIMEVSDKDNSVVAVHSVWLWAEIC